METHDQHFCSHNEPRYTTYYNTFLELINNHYDQFPQGQRKVAQAILDHPELLSCFSLAELAKRIDSSQATIIRFCRSLGFQGFHQFTKEVQQALQAEISSADRFGLDNVSHVQKNISCSIKNLLEAGHNNILSLEETLNDIQFKKSVDAMVNADNIFILGRMSSHPLALHFYQMLSKIADNVHLLDRTTMHTLLSLKKITPRSVFFSILFPRYPQVTFNITKQAAELNATVISITNSRLCPTVPFSTYTLLAPVHMVSYIDVYISPITLLSALAIAYGQHNPDKTQNHLRKFDLLAKNNGVFVE